MNKNLINDVPIQDDPSTALYPVPEKKKKKADGNHKTNQEGTTNKKVTGLYHQIYQMINMETKTSAYSKELRRTDQASNLNAAPQTPLNVLY